MNLLMASAAALLFGIGTYLVLQRKLSRIIIGIGLLGHGTNILFLVSGQRGKAAIVGSNSVVEFSDPMPQSLVLTAIVITFGVTAFLLALAFRSFLLTHDDEVEDDVEDRLVAAGGFVDDEVTDEEIEEEELDEDEGRSTSRVSGAET